MTNAVGTFGIILIGNFLGFNGYNPFSGGYSNKSNASIVQTNKMVKDIAVEIVFKEVERYLGKS